MKIPKGLRIGQTLYTFLTWLTVDKGYGRTDKLADTFFIPDKKLKKLYKEFVKECKSTRY